MPALRARRFIPNEITVLAHRSFAPHDDNAFGLFKLTLDRVSPFLAAADVHVPPNRQAVSLDCLNQRRNPLAILRLVRDEYVGHAAAPVFLMAPEIAVAARVRRHCR